MNRQLKQALPHFLVVLIFIIISFLYFYPVIQGKVLLQMDDIHAKGMSKELVDYEKTHPGEYSAWTNSMFGGMPAYQIKAPETFNIFNYLRRFLYLGLPYSTVSILFIYLLGFYILGISLGYNKWLSFLGSVAFAFGSYNLIIIAAGHITKAYAIAYMAPVIAGVIITYRKKPILGGIFTTLALGLEISANHPQINYYLAIAVGLYVLVEFVYAIREKYLKQFSKATAILVVAAILSVLPNITNLLTTYEYGKYSIRGKSELTRKDQSQNGLDKDYALAWSYGIGESFTLLIPDFKGGASQPIGNDNKALANVDRQFKEYVSQNSRYWGDQPFTSGPVYAGAIVVFLFVLGLFIVEGRLKWWILISFIVSLVLAWGKNIPAITDILFNYLPMYNKFRTVAMGLVIASLLMPLMALLTLKKIIETPEIIKQKKNYFFAAFALTGGLALIFAIFPGMFDYMTPNELSQIEAIKQQQPQYAAQYDKLIENIVIARQSIMKADAIRSFIYILLASGLLWIFASMKFRNEYFIAALTVLIIADLWTVDTRYLGADKFQRKSSLRKEFSPSPADQLILKDKDPNFRVLNLTRNVFNDGYTPYFHKSIGGYHGAKLRRYQDLIDRYLLPNINYMYKVLKETPDKLYEVLQNMHIINMLNTKYIIVDPNSAPVINMNAYGNAWFVQKYELVNSADEEIERLGMIDPKTTAIINKNKFPDFVKQLPDFNIVAYDSSYIKLVSYEPNHLIYKSITYRPQLAVFSEIYYPDGWQAYIDKKPVPHACANYVLRTLVVPEGTHTIEFKFEPKSVDISRKVSAASSTIILLIIAGYALWLYKQRKQENINENKE